MTRTLVLGGVRSGKSAWAESLLDGAGAVTYVATARARDGDPDWAARVEAHRRRRPDGWATVEAGGDPDLLLATLRTSTGAVLVDDLGNWLTSALDRAGAWDHPDGARAVDPLGDSLVDVLTARSGVVVLVSPEVGWGVLPATRAGRVFADAQGRLNQRVATVCDRATLVVAGLPIALK